MAQTSALLPFLLEAYSPLSFRLPPKMSSVSFQPPAVLKMPRLLGLQMNLVLRCHEVVHLLFFYQLVSAQSCRRIDRRSKDISKGERMFFLLFVDYDQVPGDEINN